VDDEQQAARRINYGSMTYESVMKMAAVKWRNEMLNGGSVLIIMK